MAMAVIALILFYVVTNRAYPSNNCVPANAGDLMQACKQDATCNGPNLQRQANAGLAGPTYICYPRNP